MNSPEIKAEAKTVSMLMVGGCMITGWNLPPTRSLPVLVKRGFREDQDIHLKLDVNGGHTLPREMYDALDKTLDEKEYSLILVQFLNNQIIPTMGIFIPMTKRKIIGPIMRFIKFFEKRLMPGDLRMVIRSKVLGKKPCNDYGQELENIVLKIKEKAPGAQLMLMTPVAPTSKVLKVVEADFMRHREVVKELAARHNAAVVDIFEALNHWDPAEVYVEQDGWHISAHGQKVISETIIETTRRELKTLSAPKYQQLNSFTRYVR